MEKKEVNALGKIGRREQKKQTNRRAILDAGLQVFSSIGYERATIMDIVAASGLSVGTLYNHFGDKDTIFSDIVGDLVSEVRVVLNDARSRAHDLDSFVMGAFLAYSELMEQQPNLQQLIRLNSNAFRQFISAEQELIGLTNDLQQDMQLAIDAGLMPNFPVKLMTSAIIGASVEVLSDTYDGYTSTQKATFLGNLFLGGIQRLSTI